MVEQNKQDCGILCIDKTLSIKIFRKGYTMKNLSQAHIILDCFYRLSKCICFDNIENTEYIKREISQKFKDYICENLNPLLR